jgi:DNA-binding transcriptional ArsR family regulator
VALFAQFAAVAKSLAHAHRLELLEQLAQGERSVEVLAERTGRSVANASQHLQQMRRAGIVATRREGKFVFCTLADEAVLDLMSALRRIAEQNIAEVERVIRSYFNDRDSLQPVSREIVIRSCAVAMTPASACSVHKRRPWLPQEARVSRPDGVRGWGTGGTPPGASPLTPGPPIRFPRAAAMHR